MANIAGHKDVLFFIGVVLAFIIVYSVATFKENSKEETFIQKPVVFQPTEEEKVARDPNEPLKMGHIERKSALASQFHQDAEFKRLMGDVPVFNGFFIEFGCADGVSGSNTYFFERAWNWTGLCIEAHPHQIEKATRARPGSIVLNYGIGKTPGIYEFWYLTDKKGNLVQEQISGFVDFYSDVFKRIISDAVSGGAILNKVPVEIVTLTTLLERYFEENSIIDILSMDCEGCEWEALQGIDFGRWKFSLVTYELNTGSKPHMKEMNAMMEKNDYFLVSDAGDNPFYKHKY